MERFDTIVVGAGPAGSTTAYRLARAGARVLLLDRARFPRDKPCGGGLTGRALGVLPFPVDEVVEDVAYEFEFRLRYGARFARRSARPLVALTQRSRLDAFLAERAVEAGAEFRDATRVEGVNVNGEVEVRAAGTTIRAATLLGADGANGVVARSLDLAGGLDHGVALEGNVPHARVNRDRYAGRLVLELGVVPGGYAWVFPKGDHVNVGVGGWEDEGPRLRDHLRRLCSAHGLALEDVESLRGHRLPMRPAHTRLAAGRVALVGDAAGLVDPVSGDGMYEAFVSGKLAAAHVLELLAGRVESLDGYADEVTRALAGITAASWSLKSALDRFPRASFTIVRLPPMWRVVEGIVLGDLAEPAQARGPIQAPLRLLRALGR